MNLLKIFPKKLRESYEKNILNSGIKISPERYFSRIFVIILIFSLFISFALVFFGINPFLSFFLVLIIINIIVYYRISLSAIIRIKKIEDLFPDFIQLMSSNLRAGLTIDRAFSSSARAELAPLDEEILITGREVATGQDIIAAFKKMADRINSEKIEKTIFLIISGLRAGGNISTLLETTASNMREKEFLEKRAASNVLMYIIFIFVAIGFGSPLLFGLSSILVEIIVKLTSQMPATSGQMSLPFTLSAISISPTFVIWFSLIFLIVINITASLLIGLVNKGDEKYGLTYMAPMALLSVGIFFLVRIFIYRFLAESFAIVS